jgi:hypothetical protein
VSRAEFISSAKFDQGSAKARQGANAGGMRMELQLPREDALVAPPHEHVYNAAPS